jgi:hypothetical protein
MTNNGAEVKGCYQYTDKVLLATVQTLLGFVTLIVHIYNWEPILTIFSVSCKDLQHRCFSKVDYERTVTQPDIRVLLKYNYHIQIQETGFAVYS